MHKESEQVLTIHVYIMQKESEQGWQCMLFGITLNVLA